MAVPPGKNKVEKQQHNLMEKNRSIQLWMGSFYFDTLMKVGKAPAAKRLA